MRRGELWTAAGGGPYASKPRPVLVVQSDLFDDLGSIIVVPLSSDETGRSSLRPIIEPTPSTGLKAPSVLMADKIVALPRDRFGYRIGVVGEEGMARLALALATVLGLA